MVKDFINSLIPPIIKKSLTNIQTRLQKKPLAEWVSIKDGPLQGFRIFIDPTSNLGEVLLNDYDDFIYDYLPRANTKSHLVFYDIGAHFGFHTLGFSAIAGENGKVFAFEPHPMNRTRLLKNISGNNLSSEKIVVIDQAISDHAGTVNFEMITDIESGWSSSSRILEKDSNSVEGGVKRHIQVSTDTIDNLVSNATLLKPDYIKIDVEGGEFQVLQGARNTILKFKPILFIEIHTMECMFLVQQFLFEAGYSISLIHKESDGRCFIKGEILN